MFWYGFTISPECADYPPTGLGAEIGDGATNTAYILSTGNCPNAPAEMEAVLCTSYTFIRYHGLPLKLCTYWILEISSRCNSVFIPLTIDIGDSPSM